MLLQLGHGHFMIVEFLDDIFLGPCNLKLLLRWIVPEVLDVPGDCAPGKGGGS